MYDKEMENDIRATEIALGNPPNRGVSRPRPVVGDKVLFIVHI